MTLWPFSAPLAHGLILLVAVVWDRVLGEPPAGLHPVVWMGTAIRWMRHLAPRAPGPAFLWGLLVAVSLPVACGVLGALLVQLPVLGPVIGVWLLTSSFSIRGLRDAGSAVADRLEEGDLDGGRKRLSWLCSRDAAPLNESEVAAGALESVAENASDSAVAPLFWFVVGGLPAVLAYRCVNTLDAMIGYRGETEWLGKASARLDDAVNFLPARITAGCLSLAALGRANVDPRRGLRVLRRDRNLTSSPNAGWPMATMAGLVGVRLEKRDHYVLGGGLEMCDARALRTGIDISDAAMSGFALSATLLLGALAWS